MQLQVLVLPLVTVVHFPVVCPPLGGFVTVHEDVLLQDPSEFTAQLPCGTKCAACNNPTNPACRPHGAACRYIAIVAAAYPEILNEPRIRIAAPRPRSFRLVN